MSQLPPLDMDNMKPTALFDVFLRLRPAHTHNERFLQVQENDNEDELPTHITINPPTNDTRRKAVETFEFTGVFEEAARQRDVFDSTGILPLLEGVMGEPGKQGRDGLLATLGVSGSGKSHTILGDRSQRGLTQLSLDVLYQHLEPYLADSDTNIFAFESITAADNAESHLHRANDFLDGIYDNGNVSRLSRATTPAFESSFLSVPSSKRYAPRLSELPSSPSTDDITIAVDDNAEYAIVMSMYEVHNDRIYDLLAVTAPGKTPAKRRALLFKATEASPDRKVVAGLKKVVCSTFEDALLVLETGLRERQTAGTGSNATSSRSHGFFCFEVKKRYRGRGAPGPWSSSTMTIADLAGSERARQAKTAGATLAEGGAINTSLMYLGQCMQMQVENAKSNLQSIVPFRQCKLTELLFSDSLAQGSSSHRSRQKGVMIVTADPLGDYNATSQILRYSALAKKIENPRVPSTAQSIGLAPASRSDIGSGRATPSAIMEDLEAALEQITKLRDELEVTQLQLQEETNRRLEAEAAWANSETRIDEMLLAREEEIRLEIYDEMEAQMTLDQRKRQAARDEELDRQDDYIDRKLEILARGISIYEDDQENIEPQPLAVEDPAINGLAQRVGSLALRGTGRKVSEKENPRMTELENENSMLRAQLANSEREKGLRSPSKKVRVLKTRKWEGDGMGLDDAL
ncbi:P-loop containing nucleoside triphosphate hydrolase protein [Sphaerulina musiva SO2202]|uniref:p-loop containing nucleoside triphosphate hydrolase protein n=1 Tax=Sphaerulina musiva (strain SO2202) TaxID=692275 RepID=M3BUV5_SPHMS|nr:P-loop containing nucleoside triphosphate hydrolase protein [Sphaerulina musiva SO2202]EMF11119.1 P-loop containing nucleoside triphosphate hydrolase protein [Sphaerulina musiva SO2202]